VQKLVGCYGNRPGSSLHFSVNRISYLSARAILWATAFALFYSFTSVILWLICT